MARTGVYAVFFALVGSGCAHEGALQTIPQTPLRLPTVAGQSPAESAPVAAVETLDQAWAMALTADGGIRAQRWNESAAEQAARSSWAERWPVVGINGAYTARSAEPSIRAIFEGVPLPSETFPITQSEDFAARAKIDLPIYTSGRIQQGIAAAEAERTAVALETEDAISDLKLRVGEVYLAVLRAQRDADLTESTVRSLESYARDVETRFHWGQVPQTDLLAAQVSLSHAQHAVIQARNRLDASRAAYNRHLGRPLTATVRLAELSVEPPTNSVDELTSRAMHTRPGLARVASRIEALEHRAESVRAKSGPQVVAQGEYAYQENRYQVPEGIASAKVGVTWNLFDGGRNRFEASTLFEQAEGLRCRREELESIVALEVRRAWLDVQETRRRLDVTPEAIHQAEENLRAVRERYRVGTATNTEVLDAERLRTQAYRNHDDAAYKTVLAVLRLRHATGELGKEPVSR